MAFVHSEQDGSVMNGAGGMLEKTIPRAEDSLLGQGRAALETRIEDWGYPRFRARDLFHWIYARGCRDFAEMQTVPKSLRERLESETSLRRVVMAGEQIAKDGTRKWLFQGRDGALFETVYIPEQTRRRRRGTLCVSSQVGCALKCAFCHTGTQNWVRDLSPYEIVSQLMYARDCLDDWPSAGVARASYASSPGRALTNIVFMGMGEPLLNYEAVAEAVKLMTDDGGLGFSRRRVTISTAGVVPKMERLGRELGVRLAVSLHAADDRLRTELVPLNRKWNLAALLNACRTYPRVSNAERITFEYVMLDGINDSEAQAGTLVEAIKGIPAKINLIPFNPWPGSPYRASSSERIAAFAAVIRKAGYAAPVRAPRGLDILAACGQLKSATESRARSRSQPRCKENA